MDGAFGAVQADAFRQRREDMLEKWGAGQCAQKGIAEGMAVADGGPFEAAEGRLANLGEQRFAGTQALKVEIAETPRNGGGFRSGGCRPSWQSYRQHRIRRGSPGRARRHRHLSRAGNASRGDAVASRQRKPWPAGGAATGRARSGG